jgi:hypothetical protein
MEGGHRRLDFFLSRERAGGLAIAVLHVGGEGGVQTWVARGQAATAAGLTTTGTGGCRRRGTGEGRGWLAGMWAGSQVGPATEREREKGREGDVWGQLQCHWFKLNQTKPNEFECF